MSVYVSVHACVSVLRIVFLQLALHVIVVVVVLFGLRFVLFVPFGIRLAQR